MRHRVRDGERLRHRDPSACATSYATPHAAGAAALVRQYFTEGWYPTGSEVAANAFTPTGALMRRSSSARRSTCPGPAGYPNNTEGWGLLRLDRALIFSDNGRNLVVRDVRNSLGLRTGENFTQRYTVNPAGPGSCGSCSPTPTRPGRRARRAPWSTTSTSGSSTPPA